MEFNQHFSSSSRETLSVLTYSLRGYLAQATVKATFQAQEGLSRMPFLTRKQTTCENRILRISCKQSNINMNHMDMIQFNKHEPHGYDSLHMNMNHMYAHMNEPHEPHMNHMHEPHMNMICRHEHPWTTWSCPRKTHGIHDFWYTCTNSAHKVPGYVLAEAQTGWQTAILQSITRASNSTKRDKSREGSCQIPL